MSSNITSIGSTCAAPASGTLDSFDTTSAPASPGGTTGTITHACAVGSHTLFAPKRAQFAFVMHATVQIARKHTLLGSHSSPTTQRRWHALLAGAFVVTQV